MEWQDGEALWVASRGERADAAKLVFRSERQFLTYELAGRLPARLGLAPGNAPAIAAPDGWWLFHWLGDLYGRALRDLLRYTMHVARTPRPGLCVLLHDEPGALPSWSEARATRYLRDEYRRLEPLLALGPFHHLLPLELR